MKETIIRFENIIKLSSSPRTITCFIRLRAARLNLRCYKDLKLIDYGAQGIVCEVEDSVLDRPVAIKQLIRPFKTICDAKRTFREIKLSGSIKPHPNVISLLNLFTPQKSLQEFRGIYLVTELMDQTLDYAIKTPQNLNHNQISYLIYQILAAIKHLHSSNIIHRDPKPKNIAVNSNCNLKLLDFGLARNLEETNETSSLTPYVVTRPYRSPELSLGMEYNGNVDVWSIGCIFAELILG